MKKLFFHANYTTRTRTRWFGAPVEEVQLASVALVLNSRTVYHAYNKSFSIRRADDIEHEPIINDWLTSRHEDRVSDVRMSRDMFSFIYDASLYHRPCVVVTSDDPMQAWWFRRIWNICYPDALVQMNKVFNIRQYEDMVADLLPDSAFGVESPFTTQLIKSDDPYTFEAKLVMMQSHPGFFIPNSDASALSQASVLMLTDTVLTDIVEKILKPKLNEVHHIEHEEEN